MIKRSLTRSRLWPELRMRWGICLGLAFGLLSPGAARTAPDAAARSREAWTFQPDDYVVILVESPAQPPNHLLQAEVSVWAARRSFRAGAQLDFTAVSAGIPAFRWSTQTFHANEGNPQPRPPERSTPSPPPPGFYGENGHLPPGIYFLSYARQQVHRQGGKETLAHRIGLADEPCRVRVDDACSNVICVPSSPGGPCDASAVRRTALQFHSLFHDPEESLSSPAVPAPSRLSQGCLTTLPAFLEQIFPPSMTSPETSPLQWNGTGRERDEDRTLGLRFHGSGNALIFVVDSLSPRAADQALSLRHWLQWQQLTPEHFDAGPKLTALRKEWLRTSEDRTASLDELTSQYALALDRTSRSILGTEGTDLPWVRLGYSAELPPKALLAVDHPQVLDRAAASLRGFEAQAYFKLAQGLAATDWSRERIAAEVTKALSSSAGLYPAADLADMALALREAGDASALPDLAEALQAVGSLGSKVRPARSRLADDVSREALASQEQLAAHLKAMKAGVDTLLAAKPRIDPGVQKAVAQVGEWRDQFEKAQGAASTLEKLLTGERVSETEVAQALSVAPREVREPAEKAVAVYRGAQALQSVASQGKLTQDEIGAISTGVDVVAAACGIPENDRKTLSTVLNVGMSLATGNYVGAAMSLLGTSSQGDPNAAAFAEINAKLDALLEGQRKILESLEEVKEAIRALEARVIAQHWEVLSRLSALEDQVLLTRDVALEQLEGDLRVCRHFGSPGSQEDSVFRLRESRAQWDDCRTSLYRLLPADGEISTLHRFRTASTDTAAPPPTAGPGSAPERPLSQRFLASVATPVFGVLSRLDEEQLAARMAGAAMPSPAGTAGRAQSAPLAPRFLETPRRALSIDGLLAPERVLTYSRLAMDYSRFWLSGDRVSVFRYDPAAGPAEIARDEVNEARRILDPVIRLLNQAIAQQVLLSGHALFGEPAEAAAALPVKAAELSQLLEESALFAGTRQSLVRYLLASAAARSELRLEDVLAEMAREPNWLFTAGGRKIKSVRFETFDSPAEKIALQFEKVSSSSYRLIMVRDAKPSVPPLGRVEVSPDLLREAHESAGVTDAVEQLVAARREAVSLLALTHLERKARVSLLGQAGREPMNPLEETR